MNPRSTSTIYRTYFSFTPNSQSSQVPSLHQIDHTIEPVPIWLRGIRCEYLAASLHLTRSHLSASQISPPVCVTLAISPIPRQVTSHSRQVSPSALHQVMVYCPQISSPRHTDLASPIPHQATTCPMRKSLLPNSHNAPF